MYVEVANIIMSGEMESVVSKVKKWSQSKRRVMLMMSGKVTMLIKKKQEICLVTHTEWQPAHAVAQGIINAMHSCLLK